MKRFVFLCGMAGAAACGDNLSNQPNPDATVIDAALAIDALPPDANTAPTVGGTLAVFDAILTDPTAAPVNGVRGGTIRFSFNNLTMNGGESVFGTSAIGGCLITRFDPTHLPNPRLDAGPITVSAPATGASALLKTVGPCTLQPTFGEPDPYVCISHTQTTATAGAQDLASNSAVAYTLAAPAVNFGMTTPVTITSVLRGPNAGLGLPDETVLVVTATPHGITMAGTVPGSTFVTIAGVTNTSFNTAAGSGAAVAAVVNATTFIYAQGGTDAEASSGGTASATTNQMIGSALVINGLSNPAFNSGAGTFPIVGQINANTLIVINSAPADGAAQGAGAGSYTILNGFTPVPGGGDGRANLLGGSPAPAQTASIRIQKAANAVWPAIDQTIDVPGEARRPVALTTLTAAANTVTVTTAANHDFLVGQVLTVAGVVDTTFNTASATVLTVTPNTFTYTLTGTGASSTGGTAVKPGSFTLDATSQLAHVFPTATAAVVKYSCDNNTVGAANLFDDTCGDESTALLKAMIVSGSATKKSVQGIFPFQMPTEIPGTDTWLEWQCAFIGAKSATMPQAAVQAIIDFAPTRVEQQVLFVGGTILDGTGTNLQSLRVLSGHALAGHQTYCPRAGTTVTAATVTNVALTSNVATITTAAPHGFVTGSSVTIAGATAPFNGTFTITSAPVANGASRSFTFALTNADVAAAASAGTATIPAAISGFGTAVCPPN